MVYRKLIVKLLRLYIMRKFFEIIICVLCGALVVFLCAASIWDVSHIEEVGTAKLYWDDHYGSLAITTHKQGYLVDRGDFLAFRRAGEGDEVTYLVRPYNSTSVALWPKKITVKEMKMLYTLDRLKPVLAFVLVGFILGGMFLYWEIKTRKLKKT